MKNKIILGSIIIGLFFLAVAVIVACKKKGEDDADPIRGCTNPTSLTYNAAAEEDDGSCLVPEVRQRALLLNFTATW